jgi:hypothetical protein
LFVDDRICHSIFQFPFDLRTAQNRFQSTQWHILTKLAKDGNRLSFRGMPELPVTALGCLQVPAVRFQQANKTPAPSQSCSLRAIEPGPPNS